MGKLENVALFNGFLKNGKNLWIKRTFNNGKNLLIKRNKRNRDNQMRKKKGNQNKTE